MALWDELAERRADIAEVVAALDEVLRSQPPSDEPGRYLDRGLEPDAAEAAAWPWTAPHGIYGAGAWVLDDETVPALFVLPELAPPVPVPVRESQAGLLVAGLDRPDLDRVVAVPLPPPDELTALVAPGRGIVVGARPGTLGWTAAWNGLEGVLTAGHVARDVGALVRDDAGGVVGLVERTISRHGQPAAATTADVAFVRADLPGPAARPALVGLRPARDRDDVDLVRHTGARRTWVRGLSPSYCVAQREPAWGQVALTADPVGRPGDSGAPVLGADGSLVGHVVGGTAESYSVVQDAEYQLDALGARLL